ncbi:glycosyltransferase [Chloroflexota bacterium]
MNIDAISISLIFHLLLWMLGFLFLFRIPYCENIITKIKRNPSLSVIIPARNEEKNLPYLLASLKCQVPLPDEIIVVDDYSEDRTKILAEQQGAMVVVSQPLPEGWLGKTWACYQGSQRSTGEILVFLDADTVLEENGLRKIIGTYMSNFGVFSIQPFHRMIRFYEQFSAFFNIIIMAAMGSFTIIGNRIKPIGLFGPAMVLTRKQYNYGGGHEMVKGDILEDLAYGSALKREEVRIHCYGGRNAISFRMYPNGIKELINGWSKGFALGATKTSIPVLIMIVAWIIGGIGTIRYLIQAITVTDTMQIMLWAIQYLCYVTQIYWMLRRIGNFKFYTALFYPIPLLFFVLVFAYSFVLIFLKRTVKWKGREIDLKRNTDK